MNILPLVSAFILILSIGSLALLRHCKAAYVENKDCHPVFAMQREIYREKAHKIYEDLGTIKKNDKEPKKNNIAKDQESKPKEYQSPRENLPPSHYGKLNIALLLDPENPFPALREIALKLIKNIYEFTPIYSKGLEETILHILVETAKAHPKLTAFEDLYEHIPPEHRDLFYKIFNGTQRYKLRTSVGYPPLRDFLVINEKKDHKPVHLNKANEMILNAVFDERITRKIIYAEKLKTDQNNGKKKFLKKEEFNTLLLVEGIDLAKYGNGFFGFSTSGQGSEDKFYTDNKKTLRWKYK